MNETTVETKAVGEGPVAAFFDACARDAIDEAVACFAEDGVWVTAEGPQPGAGTTYGRDEIHAYLVQVVQLRKQFESQGIQAVFEPVMVLDDKQLITYSVRNAAGDVVDRGVDVFHLRDSLILRKDVFRKA